MRRETERNVNKARCADILRLTLFHFTICNEKLHNDKIITVKNKAHDTTTGHELRLKCSRNNTAKLTPRKRLLTARRKIFSLVLHTNLS